MEVIRAGGHQGFLIAVKNPLTPDRGRIVVYWLLDPDGKEVRRIGETEPDVVRFRGGDHSGPQLDCNWFH